MELSEPATAVALLFDVPDLIKIKRDVITAGDAGIQVLEKWWKSAAWQNRLKGTLRGAAAGKIVGMPTDVSSSLKGLDPTEFPGLTNLTIVQIRQESLWNNDSKSIKDKSLAALDKVAGGISGALATREWMKVAHNDKRKPTRVYLTGANWHEDITKFSVTQAGWKDFNSSDLVISTGQFSYFGVSLKKKPKVQAGDPTLINRSIREALEQVNGSYENAKEGDVAPTTKLANDWIHELEQARWKTLYDIVTDTNSHSINQKWLLPGNTKDPKSKKPIPGSSPGRMTFKEMVKAYEGVDYIVPASSGKYDTKEEAAVRWRPLESSKPKNWLQQEQAAGRKGTKWPRYRSSSPVAGKVVINWKGADGRSGPIREYVNSQFTKSSNQYFATIKKLLRSDDDAAIELAEELVNHIFKITLGGDIDEKKLGRYKFGFGLCTEIGELRTKSVHIGEGSCIELNSIVCAMNKLADESTYKDKTKGYRFTLPKVDTTANGESTAAGIEFFITKRTQKGRIAKIVQVNIRYKGDFTSAPNFTAVITNEFKHSYLEGCPPGGH